MQLPMPCNGQSCSEHLQKCRYDHTSFGRRPSADDLLVLLAVGRSGRYVTAADELGLNHTTIARRIAALEQSIGGRVLARVAAAGSSPTSAARRWRPPRPSSPRSARWPSTAGRSDAGGRGPDVGDRRIQRLHRRARRGRTVQRRHPEGRGGDRRRHPPGHPAAVRTRRRSGGRRTAGAPRRGDPARRLPPRSLRVARLPRRARRADEHRRPRRASARLLHRLDAAGRRPRPRASFAPAMRESVTSTNVFVHVEATRAAAGIGLLPCFMADRHDDLVRVLPDDVGCC